MAEEITLIKREYDHEEKCPGCGYRTVTRWNLGEDESEDLAVCGDCTTRHIARNKNYTISRSED